MNERSDAPASLAGLTPLGAAKPGDRGVIVQIRQEPHVPGHRQDHGVDPEELERRLLEFGFVEGAHVEVLHQGAFGGDPIAVRLDDMRVALRRRDAGQVWLKLEPAEHAA